MRNLSDQIIDQVLAKFLKLNQEYLPQLVSDVIDEKLLVQRTGNEINYTLDIDGATELLKVSKQTIYQNIKSIPHRKIFGRLVFLRDELLEFIDKNGNTDVRNKGDPN